MAQITIIGLNTCGASLGLALRKSDQQLTVVGVDRDPMVARRAQQTGAVERIERWAEDACKKAALVILAEPISRMHDTLEAIAASLPQGCIVTSVAPLIAPVLAWADQLLPDGVSFIAGHLILDPVRSDDEPGPEFFQRAQYCIVPSVKATSAAMDTVSGIASLVGARPFFLDAAEHDGLVTAVDELAELLGLALLSAATGAPSWRDMRRMAGPAFERVTAGATDPAELVATLQANRENVARWLETFRDKLSQVRAALLAEEAEQLTKILTDAQEARDQWLRDHQSGRWDNVLPPPPQVNLGELLTHMVWPQTRRPPEDDKRKR